MNGVKGRLWLKLTALLIAMLSSAFLAISAVAVAIMLENNVFFDGGQSLEENVSQSCIGNKMEDVVFDVGLFEPYGDVEDEGSEDIYLDEAEDQGNESEGYVTDTTSALVGDEYYPDYSSALTAEEIGIEPLTSKDISSLASRLDLDYSKIVSNLSIQIYNSAGDVIYSNFAIDDAKVSLDRELTVNRYGELESIHLEFTGEEELNEFRDEYLSHVKIVSMNIYEYDNISLGHVYAVETSFYPVYRDTLTVNVSIPATLEAHDDIYIRYAKMDAFVANKNLFIFLLVVSTVVFCTCFVYLMSAAGYNERDKGIHLSFFDKIPLEIVLCAAAACIAVCILFAADIIYYSSMAEWWVSTLIFMVATAVSVGVVMVTLMTIAARYKGGKLFRYTIIIGGIILLYKFFRMIFLNFKYTKKAVVLYTLLFLYDMLNIIAVLNGSADYGISMFLLGRIAVGIGFIVYVAAFGKIKDGCQKISGGDADATINTERMPHELKSLANDINSIGNGIHLAVDERMKSERLKTELITNVSHDLKTPLTSIVNYVDILSKQDIKPDEAKEYVDVLVRQSQRMKKLIDDLVEASKASSGAIPVNFERSDMTLLLTQAVTEYEDKFAKARLTPVVDVSSKPVPVMIDGRLMWRVLDNLIGNICKYAQPDTRVYISETETNNTVTIVFKNVSKYPLNISSEELMERFVRGDSSRSTEGSGLGLSIAKGLCNLQNVKFEINIDGDLFKAELTINKIPEPDPETYGGGQNPAQSEQFAQGQYAQYNQPEQTPPAQPENTAGVQPVRQDTPDIRTASSEQSGQSSNS